MHMVVTSPRSRAAFSLIEVLLAVLVLGIGLLGLAAVFPVVITQQREAADDVAALSVFAAAEGTLRDPTVMSGFEALIWDPGFGRLASAGTLVAYDANSWTDGASLLWYPTMTWAGHTAAVSVADATGASAQAFPGATDILDAYRQRGGVQIGAGSYVKTNRQGTSGVVVAPGDRAPGGAESALPQASVIQVDARLVPPPYFGTPPRFVWDFVPRLKVDPLTRVRSVQAAVFVRRVESGIRLQGQNASLSSALSVSESRSSGADETKRLPVGMNMETLAPSGIGARVGGWQASTARSGIEYVYAHPIAAEAYVAEPSSDQDRLAYAYDLIVVRAPAMGGAWDAAAEFAWSGSGVDYGLKQPANRSRPNWLESVSAPRQLLVDNLGVVRTVVREVDPADLSWTLPGGIDEESEVLLRVTPPLGRGAARANPAQTLDEATLEERATKLWQVVFTPQVPVAARVIDLDGGGS